MQCCLVSPFSLSKRQFHTTLKGPQQLLQQATAKRVRTGKTLLYRAIRHMCAAKHGLNWLNQGKENADLGSKKSKKHVISKDTNIRACAKRPSEGSEASSWKKKHNAVSQILPVCFP